MKLAFWTGFAIGTGVVVIGSTNLGTVEVVHGVISWMAAPGTFVTLVLHNLVETWWWALSLIALGNGLAYGLVAAAAAWVVRKYHSFSRWE